MLKIITKKTEIKECQTTLETTLEAQLSSDSDIWYVIADEKESSLRYWFGLSKDHSKNILELTIPKEGINKKVQGIFAKNNGNLMLLHRGGIYKQKKEVFLEWYKEKERHQVIPIDKTQAVLIGTITADNFVEELIAFIKNVVLFKNGTEECINELTDLSDEEPRNYLESKKPKKREITLTIYERDTDIVKKAKKLAKGKCQLCFCDAPFNDKDESPFLETHHIIWLSREGDDSIENTIALCPNCHRKMHILDLEKDKEILKKRVKICLNCERSNANPAFYSEP